MKSFYAALKPLFHYLSSHGKIASEINLIIYAWWHPMKVLLCSPFYGLLLMQSHNLEEVDFECVVCVPHMRNQILFSKAMKIQINSFSFSHALFRESSWRISIPHGYGSELSFADKRLKIYRENLLNILSMNHAPSSFGLNLFTSASQWLLKFNDVKLTKIRY